MEPLDARTGIGSRKPNKKSLLDAFRPRETQRVPIGKYEQCIAAFIRSSDVESVRVGDLLKAVIAEHGPLEEDICKAIRGRAVQLVEERMRLDRKPRQKEENRKTAAELERELFGDSDFDFDGID